MRMVAWPRKSARCKNCNVNYAVNVNEMMPSYPLRSLGKMSPLTYNFIGKSEYFFNNRLYISIILGIITLTLISLTNFGDNDGQQQTARSKDRDLAQARSPQPSAPKNKRSAIYSERFLRYEGSSSGQVRDVASSSDRWLCDTQSLVRFWLFASLILSGTIGLRTRGAAGTLAKKTGTTQQTQADRRGFESYSTRVRRGSFCARASAQGGAPDKETIQPRASPTDHRASVNWTQKKTPGKLEQPVAWNDALIERYESLRLYGRREQERALLVQRGMISWMKAQMIYMPKTQWLPLQQSPPISIGIANGENMSLWNLLPKEQEVPLVSLLAQMTLEVCRRMTS